MQQSSNRLLVYPVRTLRCWIYKMAGRELTIVDNVYSKGASLAVM